MNYHVTRQNGFYDDEPRVEIATALDEISPGMLVADFDEEGEYESAAEAVEAALQLSKSWYALTDLQDYPEVTISTAASIGMYPTSADGMTAPALKEWAQRRDDKTAHNLMDQEWDE